ncbi:SDR family oxidoreductase [Prochlorococcus marinus]|uniref:Short-chain dehydrogenase n=1 Tax=Prochlorococcus marinus XMU1408 TaxID=2213228 RepID=A0A318RFG6_PROMR|nr:SDR family oxidoreductase [Prochlorococcus marinus]MBW3041505.1 short-chain dehydrogenase [Prochlorococcus marinus str. XMU1408]PYE02663.1 short-chain dehydrogenase [Prochlorococcus marinus XMU1408]
MNKKLSKDSRFKGLKIAITGASGSLGKALIEELKRNGAYVIGLTHSKKNNSNSNEIAPDDWIFWSCGEEKLLSSRLANIDILILNHGFNPKEIIDTNEINKAIEINSLSYWRLIQVFEGLTLNNILNKCSPKEIWVNTSEAEIQIAFSPVYEITKRLIGEIVSLKKSKLLIENNNNLIIKKLILGPFKSQLNPYGILSPELVAKKIIIKAETEDYLIIVTPNPITYFIMPIIEFIRILYSRLLIKIYSK